MKMIIDAGMMKDMFKNYDRNYFTYEACEALNDYIDTISIFMYLVKPSRMGVESF